MSSLFATEQALGNALWSAVRCRVAPRNSVSLLGDFICHYEDFVGSCDFPHEHDKKDLHVGKCALHDSSCILVWYVFAQLSLFIRFFLLGLAAVVKFAFLTGRAPASYASMASKLFPIVASTPLIRPFGLTAHQFVFLLAAFEMLAAVGLFYHHKIAAGMIVAVMLGAEYVFFSQAGNPAMPSSPVCGDRAVCIGQHVFHAVMIGLAVLTYISAKPMVSAWMQASKGWLSHRRAPRNAEEIQTPTRPRRAAAMKAKKDL